MESKESFIGNFTDGMVEFHRHRVTAQYLQVRNLKQSMAVSVQCVDYACRELHGCATIRRNSCCVLRQMPGNYPPSGSTLRGGRQAFCFHQIKKAFKAILPLHFVTHSPMSQCRNRTICVIVAKFPALFGFYVLVFNTAHDDPKTSPE